jgi:adenylate kinase
LIVDHDALLSRIAKRFEEQGRPDDNPAVFETRLAAYSAQTAPLLPYYQAEGKLVEVDGMAPVDTVAKAIDVALERVTAPV